MSVVSLISSVTERLGEARTRRTFDGRGAPSAVPDANAVRRRLGVVGDGMVCARFCEQLVRLSLHHEYDLIVVGEAAMPAYDRVKLAKVLRGGTAEELTLLNAEWYAQQGIELRLGAPVDTCNLEDKTLTAAAETIPYDVLVFATGAQPVVPKIRGADSD